MKLTAIYTRAARQDLSSAADWYDSHKAGLGDQFVDGIMSIVDRICEQPTAHPIVAKNVRQAIVRKFPFSILYQVLDNQVVVVCVLHASRDPDSWQDRV